MFQLSNKWSGREAGWEENETPSTLGKGASCIEYCTALDGIWVQDSSFPPEPLVEFLAAYLHPPAAVPFTFFYPRLWAGTDPERERLSFLSRVRRKKRGD